MEGLAGRRMKRCRVWRLDVDVSSGWSIVDGLQRHGRRLKLRLWGLHSGVANCGGDLIVENLQGWRLTRRRHVGTDAGRKVDTKSMISSNLTRKENSSSGI